MEELDGEIELIGVEEEEEAEEKTIEYYSKMCAEHGEEVGLLCRNKESMDRLSIDWIEQQHITDYIAMLALVSFMLSLYVCSKFESQISDTFADDSDHLTSDLKALK